MSTLTFKQRTALHPKATIATLVALFAAGIVTAVLLLALTGSNSGALLPTVESPTIQQAPAVNSAGTGAT